MMRMWVGLQHVLNDPVSLIYTQVLLSLILCILHNTACCPVCASVVVVLLYT